MNAWVLVAGLALWLVACGEEEGGGKRREPPDSTDAGSDRDGSVDKSDAGTKPPANAGCDELECDPNATCSESTGTPKCVCREGFKGDGKTCTDIDECATDNGGCASNAACVNQPGGMRCLCNEGLTGDGKSCSVIKVNECGDAELNTCDPNAQCTDTDDGFSCACSGAFSGDGKGCGDVDECAANTDTCVASSECKNTFGAFSCECNPGFAGDAKAECKDLCAIEACANTQSCRVVGSGPAPAGEQPDNDGELKGVDALCIPAGQCVECDGQGGNDDPGAKCVENPTNTYSCVCASGSGSVGSCGTDECATGNGGCGDVAAYKCTNLANGFACSCQPGYSRDSTGRCVDTNECNATPGPCHPNAACTNTAGSFTCACKNGYSGDGKVCTDVDECAAGGGASCLADKANCVNTQGSYACRCKRGYEGDGKTSCTDLNECSKGVDDCADNAECTNTDPSANPFGYTCTCKTGLGGDGTMCSDLDECKNASLFDCPANSTCVNTEGSYECKCGGGLTGDDPEHCYCDLSGWWAVRQDVDLCWCDRVLADVTIVSGGNVEATVWELHKLAYDGEKVVVEKKGCGSDNEPDFVSPYFTRCPVGQSCPPTPRVEETYSSYVPATVFDRLTLQRGKDIPEPEIVPGSMFTTPNEAALAGIDLGPNPETASWPTRFIVGTPTVNEQGGAAPAWADTDDDGEPGFTFWPRFPSDETERSTSAARRYYSYLPLNVADQNGTTVVTHRAGCVSLATRVVSHLNADVVECDRIVGNVVNVKTEGRVHSCIKVPESEWEFDNVSCSADDWEAATMRCEPADIERYDEQDQSNTNQATFEMIKIGEPDDKVDCAAVRKALPAIKRTPPTPISCACQ